MPVTVMGGKLLNTASEIALGGSSEYQTFREFRRPPRHRDFFVSKDMSDS
jgi:hypothetical protein